jgi:hypothetical protein
LRRTRGRPALGARAFSRQRLRVDAAVTYKDGTSVPAAEYFQVSNLRAPFDAVKNLQIMAAEYDPLYARSTFRNGVSS